VYAAADEVELRCDGELLGVAAVGAEKAFRARFETRYQPGELVAIARSGDCEVGRMSLRTAGEVGLVASAEQETVAVDGLGFIGIALADTGGVVACDEDRMVTVTITGPAELAGVGTGRIRTEESFTGPSVTTYEGRALAIVRPTEIGEVVVTVTSAGLAPAVTTARIVDSQAD
jgi:hypothetical protein